MRGYEGVERAHLPPYVMHAQGTADHGVHDTTAAAAELVQAWRVVLRKAPRLQLPPPLQAPAMTYA